MKHDMHIQSDCSVYMLFCLYLEIELNVGGKMKKQKQIICVCVCVSLIINDCHRIFKLIESTQWQKAKQFELYIFLMFVSYTILGLTKTHIKDINYC